MGLDPGARVKRSGIREPTEARWGILYHGPRVEPNSNRRASLSGLLKRLDRHLFTTGRDQYAQCLERELAGFASVLDVGCGADSPLRRLTRRPQRAVGVDGFEPSIEKSRAPDPRRVSRMGIGVGESLRRSWRSSRL